MHCLIGLTVSSVTADQKFSGLISKSYQRVLLCFSYKKLALKDRSIAFDSISRTYLREHVKPYVDHERLLFLLFIKGLL